MSSLDAIIWWTILGIVVIMAIVAIVFLARAALEAKKLKERTSRYATLPIIVTVDRAQLDAVRLQAAILQIQLLAARAEAAIAALRRSPIPVDVIVAALGLRCALDELRRLEPD